MACTFSTKLNEYRIYTEDEVQDLIKQLHQADLVVGYNHISFDYEVLMAHTVMDLKDQLRSLDLMVDLEKVLGHRIKLDAVASGHAWWPEQNRRWPRCHPLVAAR